MGQCLTSSRATDPPSQSKSEPTPVRKDSPPTKQALESSEIEIESKKSLVEDTEENFIYVFKSVTTLILDRLSTALTGERWEYQAIAEEMGDKNYMSLMLHAEWKSLLSQLFDVSATESKTSTTTEDIRVEHENFIAFLASIGELKGDVGKDQMVREVQALVVRTQSKLQKAKDIGKASDLKMHCIFFINCMETLKGDVIGTKGQLFRQVDNFTKGKIGA